MDYFDVAQPMSNRLIKTDMTWVSFYIFVEQYTV